MSDLAKLSWQCRRGTLELDLLLQAYLQTGYEQADGEEQALFKALVQLEDGDLLACLLGDQKPQVAALAGLINKIRHTGLSAYEPSSAENHGNGAIAKPVRWFRR